MLNRKSLTLVVATLVTALMLSSFAITNTARSQDEVSPVTFMLLHIDGIPGESTVANYEHWITIDTFNWSEAMASVTGNVRSAGKLNMVAFQFAMVTNNASVALFLACATGRYIPSARLDIFRPTDAGAVMLLRFDFVGVTITSYSIAGNTLLYNRNDEFSIAFNRITMTYWQYDEGGNPVGMFSAYYDLIAGRGGIAP